jgi:hypothetical protein
VSSLGAENPTVRRRFRQIWSDNQTTSVGTRPGAQGLQEESRK